jgi:hypothetical protein
MTLQSYNLCGISIFEPKPIYTERQKHFWYKRLYTINRIGRDPKCNADRIVYEIAEIAQNQG